jgi:uncharacterized protein YxeA
MKRILGILLAVCFLMSVTAAAVGACENNNKCGDENHFNKFEEKHKEDHFKNNNEFRFNEHGKKKHFHPGHWENERRGHREFRDNRYIVVYEIIKVYKVSYWSSD